ncbi:MAG: peptidase, partial [Pontibacter sp.]|nr:peptidase [Pontibacter sp.]
MRKLILTGLTAGILLSSCSSQKTETTGTEQTLELTEVQQEAQAFLDQYSRTYQDLYTRSAEAEWASNTKIVEGDTTNAAATRRANEAFAAFTGSAENIEKARKMLEMRDQLTPLQVKQFDA